jgi:hypothetical protein
MRHLLNFTLTVLTIIALTAFTTSSQLDRPNKFHQNNKLQPMGVSIVLYRVGKADRIEDLYNLDKQMDKSKSINLYKITQDLGIIFMNTVDPYNDTAAIPFKLLYGTYVEKQVDDRIVNGFVSTLEVATICDWIKKHKIDHFEGFSKMYDSLSKEAKTELEDIGADDKKSLFTGYVQPLTQFYFAAFKDKNSIVICGE